MWAMSGSSPTTGDPGSLKIALVHDYLTQRGGAERVVLLMAEALAGAPIYTSLYEPDSTFPAFRSLDIRPSVLNKVNWLRRHHRFALPVLATTFSRWRIQADVVLCSSSGWAHGIQTEGRKVVYCYTPARWLYQPDRYLLSSGRAPTRSSGKPGIRSRSLLRQHAIRTLAGSLGEPLRKWDRHAAASADVYLTSSSAMATAIHDAYGIDAEVVPPPPALGPRGPEEAIHGIEPGYFLCIARLLPYKNVRAIVEAVQLIPGARLVVVGEGPERNPLQAIAGPHVHFTGAIEDEHLRWLYRNALALVAASYEDYGLTPLEAAAFGRPSIVLRGGGFLDTVIEGDTGIFFDLPASSQIAVALSETMTTHWNGTAITAHAEKYGTHAFRSRIRDLVIGHVQANDP
jgi:glycosyltransferase involved in cell wall biosynthesis